MPARGSLGELWRRARRARRVASAGVSRIFHRSLSHLRAPFVIAVGAVLLRLLYGVGFANYDTLYALDWGGQLARGELPAYGTAVAPTPHPLIEMLGLVLSPLQARTIEYVAVALGYLALSACGWVIYRLGREWLNRPVGAFAALILLTRVPILSYGSRAYIDIPYLLLVLCALLVQTRRPRAGAPVLALLSLAGLLRPEAWAFAGLYWLYLAGLTPRWAYRSLKERSPQHRDVERSSSQLAWLALLAASAPLIWVVSDLLITGNPLWSLTNTRHTAETLDRVSGIGNVPEYIPRRIGEIMQVPGLLAAALGGALSLAFLAKRVRLGVATGVIAVIVFAALASVGLPINTRYAFLAAAILCVFAGAGVFGWMALERDDQHRRWWMLGSALVLIALAVGVPSQYRTAHHELAELKRQQRIQNELLALVKNKSITLRCGPVEVTDHAPVPLLALYLKSSPARVISAQSSKAISSGTFVEPADAEVQSDYILDPKDPVAREVSIPPGFQASRTSHSWLIFEKC